MMDSLEGSGFRFYSFGIAAENKPDGSMQCEVIPLETSNFLDGEATKHGNKLDIDITNHNGVQKSEQAVSSTSIPATWLCLGESNRITAPNIRRGEEVIIFTYADTNQYYWTPRNTNRYVRKLETVVMAFSGTKIEGDKTVTDTNHYLLEISTHKGHMVFSTSAANGEVCRWFVQIRGSDGKFIVCNELGDEILIDSVESLIRLINQNDTEIEMIKKDINVKVPGNYGLDVKGNQKINVTGNSDITVTGNSTVTVNGDSTVNVSGNASITAGGYTIVSANISLNGNVSIAGGLVVAGSAYFPGGHGPH